MGKLLYPVVDGKKECGKCHKWQDVSRYEKHKKKYYSSMCRDCLKVYRKEYRDDPINKQKQSVYMRNRVISEEERLRHNEKIRDYKKQNHVRDKNNELNAAWKSREKKRAVDYKGGACEICGYNKCLSALQFHHVDPDTKGEYKSYVKFEKNIEELDKCILLCANCHSELHSREVWQNE